MIIKFQIDGEEKVIKTDGTCFMPFKKWEGKTLKGDAKDAESVIGYFTSLGRAVKKHIDVHMGEKENEVTLLQYVERYERAVEEVKGMLKDVEF